MIEQKPWIRIQGEEGAQRAAGAAALSVSVGFLASPAFGFTVVVHVVAANAFVSAEAIAAHRRVQSCTAS